LKIKALIRKESAFFIVFSMNRQKTELRPIWSDAGDTRHGTDRDGATA
jgi:hypothetical protein